VGEKEKRILRFMDEHDTVTTDAIPQCTFLLAQMICLKKKQQQGGH